MKLTYKVFKYNEETVCIPSTDYYRRSDGWETNDITNLKFVDEFDTPKEAEEFISKIPEQESFNSKYDSGDYLIIPTYKILKRK